MSKELIIYSHKNITVTTSAFIVDSARYLIDGIESVRMHFVRHYKYPPYTILLIGLAGIIAGVAGLFSQIQLEELYIGDLLITANRLSVIIGFVLGGLGLAWLAILHNEYVAVITTTDGYKIPISSTRRNHITQVVAALKVALEKSR